MACDFGRFGWVLSLVCAAACGGSPVNAFNNGPLEDGSTGGSGPGSERQACYPNHTCNDGLMCFSDVCVRVGDSGALGDAASAPVPDAGSSVATDAGPSSDAAGQPDVRAGAAINAVWLTVNDCSSSPGSCTTGGNEAGRDFDGAPFCTKGATAIYNGNNWGSSLLLAFRPEIFNATAAGVIGFSFDITGKSPSMVDVAVQSKPVAQNMLAVSEYGNAPVGGHVSVMLDQLETLPFASPIDPAQLTVVGCTVVADDAVAVPFDYCVANFSLIKR